MKEYKPEEVADLLEQAEKLKIQLYSDNTIEEVELLIKQELRKFTSKLEKYD